MVVLSNPHEARAISAEVLSEFPLMNFHEKRGTPLKIYVVSEDRMGDCGFN
jgi:hypothetical protein